jgi:hypothetical protein
MDPVVVAAIVAPDFGVWSVFDPAQSNPTGASTRWDGGRATFENASYLISVGDDETVLVANLASGESYLAWSPPQLWVDGEHAFDFFGTTTLLLEDGTKLTIETQPLADDPLATAANKVVITNHDYGVEVFGLSRAAPAGSLGFVETLAYGWLLDAVVGDGNTIVEQAAGPGFVGDADGDGQWEPVDMTYIEATDMALVDAAARERGAAWLSFTHLVSSTLAGWIRSPVGQQRHETDQEHARTLTDAERLHERRTGPPAPAHEWRIELTRDGAARLWSRAGGPQAPSR